MVIIFFNTGLYKSQLPTNCCGKLVFLSFRALPLFVLCRIRCKLCKLFNIHNHCFYSGRFQVFCVFALTYFKQFVKKDTSHKDVTIAFKKNIPLESFGVLKKNIEHSQTEKVKKTLSTNLRSRNFVVDLWY